MVKTSKGFHCYFQYPATGTYGNKSFRNDGFDIRGVGGQVLAPGSRHPVTGNVYIIGKAIEPIPAPEWLLKLYAESKATLPKGNANETFGNDFVEIDRQSLIVRIIALDECVRNRLNEKQPVGKRSEASMSAMLSLLNASFSPEEIYFLFLRYPVGDKTRERGKKWFLDEIKRAQDFIEKQLKNKLK